MMWVQNRCPTPGFVKGNVVPKLERFSTSAPRADSARVPWHPGSLGAPLATIEQMSEPTQPLEHQLEEIGTQLAWVRDYL